MKAYILTLTAFVFITSLVMGLLPEGHVKKTVKLVSGMIMALLVIMPVSGLKTEKTDITGRQDEYTIYSESIEKMQKKQLEKQLEEGLQNYFLDENIGVVIENGIICISGSNISRTEAARVLGISENVVQMTE